MPTEKKPIGILWPTEGRSDRAGQQTQPPLTTTAGTLNVWPIRGDGRRSGGSRPAVVKRFPTQVGHPMSLGTVSYIPGAADRISTNVVAIGGGRIWASVDGASDITNIESASVNPSEVLSMAEHNQKLYIADFSSSVSASSVSYFPKIYDPEGSPALTQWTASAGTLPLGCPVICTFRDRIVLAGGTTNPYGVFFSEQGDPTNWDYSATATSGAVSLGLAFAGAIGETVTAMWPHADDCLILGCPNSLWLLKGDPKDGSLANLSSAIGIVDKHAFCTTPDGWFVFLSADGLYAIPAGCGNPIPQSISRDKLPLEMLNIDRRGIVGGTVASLAYDIYNRGVHIFLTSRDTGDDDPGDTHWFMDWETKSLWEVQFGGAVGGIFNPWSALAQRSRPSDRSVVLLGCKDGYVRYFDADYDVDDEDETSAKRFRSSCVFGPFGDASLLNDSRWDELEVVLSADSASVDVEIFAGETAEEAAEAVLTGSPSYTRRIGTGRSPRMHPRVRGASLYLKLTADRRWAFEAASAVLAKAGRTRV
jgi:hypothetical protein